MPGDRANGAPRQQHAKDPDHAGMHVVVSTLTTEAIDRHKAAASTSGCDASTAAAEPRLSRRQRRRRWGRSSVARRLRRVSSSFCPSTWQASPMSSMSIPVVAPTESGRTGTVAHGSPSRAPAGLVGLRGHGCGADDQWPHELWRLRHGGLIEAVHVESLGLDCRERRPVAVATDDKAVQPVHPVLEAG